MKQALVWGGMALLLLAAACGGGDKDEKSTLSGDGQATRSPGAAAQSSPTAGAGAVQFFPGEQPASPETERIDRMLGGAKFPRSVDVAGRKDIPNDGPDYRETPDIVARFKQYGRETGAYYVLSAGGTPRFTLAVSQYATADGAKKELEFGRGTAAPGDRVDAAGIGDEAAAFRLRLGGQGGPTPVIVSFTRGRYYVVIADTAAVADDPPDMALDVARAVDAQLKAYPQP